MGLENYLMSVSNLKHRKSLSQLRLSSHGLMIETGRHRNIASDKRFCIFCKTEIEDEIHFVIKCKIYDHLRKPLIEECVNLKPNFQYYTERQKFVFILTNDYLQTMLAKFVFLAEDLRDFLLKKTKYSD